jgi:hypothetical protein
MVSYTMFIWSTVYGVVCVLSGYYLDRSLRILRVSVRASEQAATHIRMHKKQNRMSTIFQGFCFFCFQKSVLNPYHTIYGKKLEKSYKHSYPCYAYTKITEFSKLSFAWSGVVPFQMYAMKTSKKIKHCNYNSATSQCFSVVIFFSYP